MVSCHTCGNECKPNPNGCGVGYGTDNNGKHHCYSCCAKREREAMVATGKACLYLTNNVVTDWPGELRFNAFNVRVRNHNWRGYRQTYVNFIGPDGYIWSGRNVGDNQILRCRRTKKVA